MNEMCTELPDISLSNVTLGLDIAQINFSSSRHSVTPSVR